MNAVALLRHAARRHPDRVAFLERGTSTTFSALWDRVCRFSGALHAAGFAPGDRALIAIPMSVELYVSLLAVLKEGGVAVFLDPWVGKRAMIDLARHANLKAWLGTPKSHLLRLFVRGVGIAPLSLHRFAGPMREALYDAHDDDRALITYTTGSSGRPKGVNRTHRILVAQHERLAEAFPSREGDVDYCAFPVFALNNLALGVTTSLDDPAAATTATASPPFFDTAPPHPFRRILTGGAPVTDLQLRRWRAKWPEAEIAIAYGSSEAEPVAHITAEERLRAGGRGYVAGKIVNGVRARIEPIGSSVPRGSSTLLSPEEPEEPRGTPRNSEEIGELLVAGDHVCRDYDHDPHATRKNKVFDPDGTVWHRMGDTGWFDEEGRFRIAGRVHSTIWRYGVPVHAQLVEQAAQGDDERIRRVAAVAVGARVAVVVESDADVGDDVRARLAAAGEPCDIVLVTRDPLPVDPRHQSKIDYDKLRARL
ncbi:MAG TPA: AMP-binding protein [Thermoanaerobaculia bacterium]|jgi:acyl-CoA synthetase (AMP-forming)/AMP-acid ligase II